MPKQKSSQLCRLQLNISEFGADIFSTDGSVLYCNACYIKVAVDKKFTIQQYITRDKHVRAVQKRRSKHLI